MFGIYKISLSCFYELMEKSIYGYKKKRWIYQLKKTYCVECNKFRKFANPKKSHTFDKTLIRSGKCYNNNDSVFKDEA